MPHTNQTDPLANSEPSLTIHLLRANAAYAIFFRGTLLRVTGESMFFETRAEAQQVVARLTRTAP